MFGYVAIVHYMQHGVLSGSLFMYALMCGTCKRVPANSSLVMTCYVHNQVALELALKAALSLSHSLPCPFAERAPASVHYAQSLKLNNCKTTLVRCEQLTATL